MFCNQYKHDRYIYKILDNIESLVDDTLSLSSEDAELITVKLILEEFSKKDDYTYLCEAINQQLEIYSKQEKQDLTNNNNIEQKQFLIPSIKKQLSIEDRLALPSVFETYKIAYIVKSQLINQEFNKILALKLHRRDQFLIEKLRKKIRHRLVDDENMNGDIPLYQRHLNLFLENKATWRKLLIEDIQNTKILFSNEN